MGGAGAGLVVVKASNRAIFHQELPRGSSTLGGGSRSVFRPLLDLKVIMT